MKQLVQSVRSGELRLIEVPTPSIGPTEVLVATSHSLLSSGTERAARNLASAGLIAKARARPDLVRQVVQKARTEGVAKTLHTVRARMQTDMPLGYSAAGVVVEVGGAVARITPGQRVATGGAGHAELQVVSGPLAVPLPEHVAFDEAAFATVASIAMNGLRLADVGPGARVCVIGLGLLGQLAIRVAIAAGCEVAGVDVRPWTVDMASDSGAFALVETGGDTTESILDWTKGRGVDAVLLTAATHSSDPIRRAPHIARDRANIVVVGDIGLELERTPLYEKELTLRFARSYGPGRYDPSYEDWGVDYPIGYVRWTEGRNLEAFIDLLAAGRLSVRDLVTHTFPFSRATEAYALLSRGEEHVLGVELMYPASPSRADYVPIRPRSGTQSAVGLIGAGTFASATLIPAMKKAGFTDFAALASASGRSATRLARDAGFERVAQSGSEVIADPGVGLVVVATRHDSHEEFTLAALEASKHVFCEKPLALTFEGLERIANAWRAGTGHLMVGFNRRHSPAIVMVRRHIGESGGPLVITYRVNAGRLPPQHWYLDRRQGGRLIGEACHFIDTCGFLVGHPVASVYCVGSARGEALLDQDFIVTLRYTDGSVATISYASGGNPTTSKERIEVLGRGHSALVDDFHRTLLDGKAQRGLPGDKGHEAEMRVLRQAILGRVAPEDITRSALDSMAATLAAAQSLITGVSVSPPPVSRQRYT
jgi:predicted dehydrogenase/threonine dehydrogenase-like Zn-dependent dehydrogenase